MHQSRLRVSDYSPVAARTRTDHVAVEPIAFDCVKFIVIRAGSARLFSEFGTPHVNVGDIAVLYALPDLATLRKLADACGQVHQSYSDHVMLAALLAARGSEVAGLRAGDVDWDNQIVWIRRQHYPGRGGDVP